MKIIKLNAIDSTNSFLKELSRNAALENFTTVVTKQQTAGKGQMGSKWASEKHKNLTVSIFIKHKNSRITDQNYLNFAICLAIYNLLLDKKVSQLSIKWPNDILSANKKICGVLIENSIKNHQLYSSVIGIGLNVNQQVFSSDLLNATSIKNSTNKETDLDKLLVLLLKKIKENITLFENEKFELLEKKYLNKLYKKNIPTTFKDSQNVLFMGIIQGVSKNGKLQILLEDDSIKEFGIKEVSFP